MAERAFQNEAGKEAPDSCKLEAVQASLDEIEGGR
jgi:hypothetical protein